MSYCKLKNQWVTEWKCMGCENCFPPSERINGILCEYEDTGETPFIDYDDENNDYHILYV